MPQTMIRSIPPRNLVFFAVLAFVLFCLYNMIVAAPQKAQKNLIQTLQTYGFYDASIQSFDMGITGFTADNILLDSQGIDSIKRMTVHYEWPYIGTKKIKSIEIDGLHITRKTDEIKDITLLSLPKIFKLPKGRVDVKNAVIDIVTHIGGISLNMDCTAIPKDKNTHDLKAKINSNQFQTGFATSWTGTIDKTGKLDLYADIVDGYVKTNAFQTSRVHGWAAVSNTNTATGGFQAQISVSAGRALMNAIPLDNLTFDAQKSLGQTNLVLRSGLSGIPDVLMTMDIEQENEKMTSEITVQGDDFTNFLSVLKPDSTKENDIIPQSLKHLGAFSLDAALEPDKIFEGGPMPYALSLKTRLHDEQEQIARGNILFYPESFDVRGSLEIHKESITGFATYFNIPSKAISQNYIRLDSNMGRAFTKSHQTP